MSKITTKEMCHGPLLRPLITYTIPIILSGILQLLFHTADLVVVGQFCGSDSVAAVGSTSSLTNLMVNLFVGFSIGVGALVAQSLGAKDERRVRHAVHTAIPLALIGGALITLIGILLAPQFLDWMDTPPEIIGLSAVYLRIYFAGMIFSMVFNYGAAILRAAGDTQSPLLFLTLSGVLNLLLNLLFVLAFKMDVAGVALATSLSQVLSAVLVLYALMKRTDACRLNWSKLTLHRQSIAEILKVGLPAGIQSSLFSITNVITQSSVNLFGKAAVAGNAASASVEGFVFTAMDSFHQTALTFTAQNYGAQNYDRIRKVFHYCMVLVFIVGLTVGGAVWLCGEPILSIFITDSPDAMRYGLLRLSMICRLYFMCGMMKVATGALRGLGRSISSMVISLGGVCAIRILWVAVVFQIPQFHTLKCLYMSYSISWIISIVLQAIVFYVALNKEKKKLA